LLLFFFCFGLWDLSLNWSIFHGCDDHDAFWRTTPRIAACVADSVDVAVRKWDWIAVDFSNSWCSVRNRAKVGSPLPRTRTQQLVCDLIYYIRTYYQTRSPKYKSKGSCTGILPTYLQTGPSQSKSLSIDWWNGPFVDKQEPQIKCKKCMI